MNIDMESEVSVDQEFLPLEELRSSVGTKKLQVEVEVSKDGEVFVSIIKSNGLKEDHLLNHGDSLSLNHTISLNATRGMRDNHIFPIELEYKNQRYKLQKTKNDKLILTK